MAKDLTSSKTDRQNILNNQFAIEEIRKAVGLEGILFENEFKFIKDQVSSFFEVDPRTIDRYLEKYSDELSHNGYEVLRGKRLQDFKLSLKSDNVNGIDVVNQAPQRGVFNFRSYLNLAMLLTESQKAKTLRGVILDIVIDTVNQKTGGGTKYINQRDEDFIVNFLRGEDYRQEFTNAFMIMLKWVKQNILYILIKFIRVYSKKMPRNIDKY